ncbi:MAG: AmmeMemoRadiSam system protein B [Nitrospirae bacterium]|nr:AmmeMemoRadiSam system protein B [Nitrospirota bacterium]
MRRPPAVAGQFYYGTATRLKSQVEQYVSRDAVREKAIGILSPHAGLMYSGYVAGAVYSSISFPETFILLGPNHTGLGPRLSLMASGEWEIPTGILPIDEELAGAIAAEVPDMSRDTQAHQFEHSLEVQLPFISYFSDSVGIVPVTVMNASLKDCRSIGEGIARAVRNSGREVVIVASSDMSHYVSDALARTLDDLALREMLDLNPEGLYTIVTDRNISMCGFIPATIMLYAAKALGALEARLVKYATSAEASGDYDHVVGYAGVVVK